MFTRDDLIDFLVGRLGPGAPAGAGPVKEGLFPNTMLPKGRIFLSEFEIKKRLTVSGEHLTIPKEAIISPLAVDWLTLKGIKITRE